ncbi:hypothetical protein NliqN6_6874 [Naganishia liquefaciens]|uniref:Uncharacterized protein n=1 Tax=Naganishia liquefaciens TaxID=104408 RepID=A0A8H3U0C5_9TREE|nr:hypothetical protein NliqN6_6874 [Naganishia liquefaciens]
MSGSKVLRSKLGYGAHVMLLFIFAFAAFILSQVLLPPLRTPPSRTHPFSVLVSSPHSRHRLSAASTFSAPKAQHSAPLVLSNLDQGSPRRQKSATNSGPRCLHR